MAEAVNGGLGQLSQTDGFLYSKVVIILLCFKTKIDKIRFSTVANKSMERRGAWVLPLFACACAKQLVPSPYSSKPTTKSNGQAKTKTINMATVLS